MKFGDIKTQIGKQVGDPELQQIRGIVGDKFRAVMTMLLMEPELYSLEEVPECVYADRQSLTFSSGFSNYDAGTVSRVMKVINVLADPVENGGKIYRMIEIGNTEYASCLSNSLLMPIKEEVKWYKEDKVVRFVSGSDAIRFTIVCLLNPDFDNWGEQDLITTLNYSERFLQMCISETAKLLREYVT